MSAVIEMKCPHCQQVIRTNARYAGMEGPCPHCGKTIKVEAPSDQVFEPVMARGAVTVPTDANTLLAGLMAGVATVVLYAVFFVLQRTYLGELFTQRGPIPFIVTFVTCWGLAIIMLKYAAVKRQMTFAELEMDFIPLQKGMHIDASNVDGFLQHLDGLPQKAREGILGRRIRGALEHFRSRASVPEVQAYLSSQAEIDASGVDSGYTLVRAFIWAIPILGFIGTVLGISAAVSGLASSLDSTEVQAPVAADASNAAAAEGQGTTGGTAGSQMIAAMGMVTQGLATAFDTTFIALVMAIFLLFPTESLKRAEYRMLDRIEAFTNDALLRRMIDAPEDKGLTPERARLLEPVFRRHQQWLMEWQGQVEKLGTTVGSDLEKYVQRISQQLKAGSGEQANETRQTVEALARSVGELNQCMPQFRALSEVTTQNVQLSLQSAQQLQEKLRDNMDELANLANRLPGGTPSGASLEAEQLATAAIALERAAQRLSELAMEHPVDGRVAGADGHAASVGGAPQRGGLFSIFTKR